ncbi:UDP-glucuronosyl/UDP-glucosyltransferase [Artemisia annua]|uniref:UDP-glucuronosyl/UDP-glucosyltransferase n=1 Tax=Artemisia annua TaxID=35608 RepID=A0A2U1KJ53_ARTAN|nr:UDP-glucuronosyl/UDP-glucosyltransferase [Artemisia annua]
MSCISIVHHPVVSDVWKIGVLLEDGLERVGIERAIKRLMEEKEGEEIRERISRVKKDTAISFDEGGSSHQSLKKLVDYVSSFSLGSTNLFNAKMNKAEGAFGLLQGRTIGIGIGIGMKIGKCVNVAKTVALNT